MIELGIQGYKGHRYFIRRHVVRHIYVTIGLSSQCGRICGGKLNSVGFGGSFC